MKITKRSLISEFKEIDKLHKRHKLSPEGVLILKLFFNFQQALDAGESYKSIKEKIISHQI